MNSNSVFVLSREHGGTWEVFSQGEQYLIDIASQQKALAAYADSDPVTTLDDAVDWFGRDLNKFYVFPDTPEGAEEFLKVASANGLLEKAKDVVSEILG